MSDNSIESLGTEEVTIEHKGRTGRYIVREITEPELYTVSPRLKDGTPDKSKATEWNGRLIALAVTRADGSAISFEEAQKFPMHLKVALSKAVMKFNALGEDAEAEAGEA